MNRLNFVKTCDTHYRIESLDGRNVGSLYRTEDGWKINDARLQMRYNIEHIVLPADGLHAPYRAMRWVENNFLGFTGWWNCGHNRSILTCIEC